jgi:hypothetical protein
VPQVRARFLGANLGCTATAFLPTFSSHFSRTLITDMHPNRCEDISTVHHPEVRPSPETNAFPAANFSRAL